MAKVLITGGTGLVGKHLRMQLLKKGYDVAVLSRTKEPLNQTYRWDIDKREIETGTLENADYIVHLSGANIGERRWTAKRKQRIIDSRVKSTQLLFDEIKKQDKKPLAFISASAIGYYGAKTSDKIYTEKDLPANDFLGNTCQQWEQAADSFVDLGVRTVKIRTGVVLSKQGGALAKMMAPVRMGMGSAIGNGEQFMPWIHIDDLCGIYIRAIEDIKMKGAYNAVAPSHINNKDFTKVLASVLKKPFWFPNIPSVAMKLMFGEMAEIILSGSRVSGKKVNEAGYHFLFPDLTSALLDLLKNKG